MSDGTLLEQFVATVKKARVLLDRCVEQVGGMLDALREKGEYDTKLGSHLAYLLEHSSRALGEIRKYQKDAKALIVNLPAEERDAMVEEYIASLPIERRRALIDRLAALNDPDFTP